MCFPDLSLAEPNAAKAGVEVAESKAGVCCGKSVIAAFLLLPVPIGMPRGLCYCKNDFSSSGGFRGDTLPSNVVNSCRFKMQLGFDSCVPLVTVWHGRPGNHLLSHVPEWEMVQAVRFLFVL